MDKNKIGKFISEERKKKNLTQEELAKKLYVTDRAISKWETGRSLPDYTVMLSLCKILSIDVNELLSGERLDIENYEKMSEENLYKITVKEQQLNKKLILLENMIGIMSTLIFITLIVTSVFFISDTAVKIVLFILAFMFFITGVIFAIKIETEVGYYECKNCKHKYIPKYKAVFFAFHIGTTRYLKCPKCKKRSWSKKIIK